MSCAAFMPETMRVIEERGRKPHTKLQEKCLRLSKELPELTEAQVKWLRRQREGEGYYLLRGRGGKHSGVWCHVCGHFDEVDSEKVFRRAVVNRFQKVGHHTCSCCGEKLKVWHKGSVDSWKNLQRDYDVRAGFITTCEGMQVVRMFNMHKCVVPGEVWVDRIDEVFEVWYDIEKDKEVILSKPYCCGFWNMKWRLTQPLKVARRRNTYNYGGNDVYDLYDDVFYGRTKVLPILKRNGWSNKMTELRSSPVSLWKALMRKPMAEVLAKTRQWNMLDFLLRGGESWCKGFTDWRRGGSYRLALVKICSRHGYIIKDAQMWNEVVDMLEELEMDIHSPKYICPESLKGMHDWLLDKQAKKRARERKESLKKEIEKWEKKYAEKKGCYLPIEFDNGIVFCHVIKSVEEMLEEGERMHHCVFDREYYKKPESLILSARDKEGKRLETVEVSLKSFRVIQSRALQNGRTKLHENIVSLVEKNMFLIRNASKESKKKLA